MNATTFSIAEFVAKVKALMRRYLVLGSEGSAPEKAVIAYMGIRID